MKRFSLKGFDTLYNQNKQHLPSIKFKNNTILSQVAQFVTEDFSNVEVIEDVAVKNTERREISSIEKFILEDDEYDPNNFKEVDATEIEEQTSAPQFDKDSENTDFLEDMGATESLSVKEIFDKVTSIKNALPEVSKSSISSAVTEVSEDKDSVKKAMNYETGIYEDFITKIKEFFSPSKTIYENISTAISTYKRLNKLSNKDIENTSVSDYILDYKLLKDVYNTCDILQANSLKMMKKAVDTFKIEIKNRELVVSVDSSVTKYINDTTSICAYYENKGTMNKQNWSLGKLDKNGFNVKNVDELFTKILPDINTKHRKLTPEIHSLIHDYLRYGDIMADKAYDFCVKNRLSQRNLDYLYYCAGAYFWPLMWPHCHGIAGYYYHQIVLSALIISQNINTTGNESITSSLESLLNSETQYTNVSEIINNANMIGNKLNVLLNTLQGTMYDEVDDLENQIVQTREEYIKKNGQEAALDNDDTKLELNATFIDWKEIGTLGSSDEIITVASEVGHLHSNNPLTIINARMTVKNWVNDIVNIDIPDDVSISVVDKITERSSDVVDNVSMVYKTLTTKSHYSAFVNTLKNCLYATQPGKDLPYLMQTFKTYTPILRAFQKGELNISDRDTDKIKENSKNLIKILQCVAMYTMACRKLYQTTNVVVLADNVINNDIFKEFQVKQGTSEDIVKHLRMKYQKYNQPIPNMGIRIDEILKLKESVFNEYENHTLNIKSKARDIKDKATLYAYREVLINYLKNVESNRIPSNLTKDGFVNFNRRYIDKSSTNLHSSNSSIEDCLYNFLLDTWYINTPALRVMYNKLVNKYTTLVADSDGVVSEEDKANATAETIADMTIEFMFKNFVEKDIEKKKIT